MTDGDIRGTAKPKDPKDRGRFLYKCPHCGAQMLICAKDTLPAHPPERECENCDHFFPASAWLLEPMSPEALKVCDEESR